jgi:hypothetical protein
MNNSQIDNVKLELMPNSTTNDGLTSVSSSIAKPNVGSSAIGYATDNEGENWFVECPNCERIFEYVGFFDSGDKTNCKCGCVFTTKYLELSNGNIIK